MWCLALLVALCVCVAPRRVHAHSFPTPFAILAEPGGGRGVVALRPGFALSPDGGESWDLLCGAAADVAGSEPFPVVLLPSGRLLVASFAGLSRDDGQGCNFERLTPTGLPGSRLSDLQLRDDGAVEGLSAAGAANGLFVSTDEGDSWSQHGSTLPEGALPTSFLRAPSDPERVYVVGRVDGGSQSVLWTSPDDGESWQAKPLEGQRAAELLAVDPTDPARLWLRRVAGPEEVTPDTLVVSSNAGDSFEVFATVTELGGFTVAPDGQTVWYGSRSGGLRRRVADDDPEVLDTGLRVGCLEHRGGRLWLCARDEAGLDPFAAAYSEDGGESWTAVLRSAQVRRLRTCGNPEQARECAEEWRLWKEDVFGGQQVPPLADAGVVDAGVGDASVDASVAPDAQPGPDAATSRDGSLDRGDAGGPAGGTGGCAVHAGGRSPVGPHVALLLWMLWGLTTTTAGRKRGCGNQGDAHTKRSIHPSRPERSCDSAGSSRRL